MKTESNSVPGGWNRSSEDSLIYISGSCFWMEIAISSETVVHNLLPMCFPCGCLASSQQSSWVPRVSILRECGGFRLRSIRKIGTVEQVASVAYYLEQNLEQFCPPQLCVEVAKENTRQLSYLEKRHSLLQQWVSLSHRLWVPPRTLCRAVSLHISFLS